MPRTKLDKFSKREAPQIDWLWAAILERKAVSGMDLKTLAKVAGVSYGSMRQYIRESPWRWPLTVRMNVCGAFGISFMIEPANIKLEE